MSEQVNERDTMAQGRLKVFGFFNASHRRQMCSIWSAERAFLLCRVTLFLLAKATWKTKMQMELISRVWQVLCKKMSEDKQICLIQNRVIRNQP
jgi:invasion protein IalB